jgi:hypothetical protein
MRVLFLKHCMDIFVKLSRGIKNERYDSILEEHLQQGVVYLDRIICFLLFLCFSFFHLLQHSHYTMMHQLVFQPFLSVGIIKYF